MVRTEIITSDSLLVFDYLIKFHEEMLAYTLRNRRVISFS